jgi:hypothetical protein
MTSYLVLDAPGGPDKDHRSTRFIADRFSWLAFVAPWLWLLANRMWLTGIAALILQLLAAQLSLRAGLQPLGILTGLGISLLTALEGRNLLARYLLSKGWEMKDIVSAPDLATAEALYFSGLTVDQADMTIPQPVWDVSPDVQRVYGSTDPAGSFQFDFNGRR